MNDFQIIVKTASSVKHMNFSATPFWSKTLIITCVVDLFMCTHYDRLY